MKQEMALTTKDLKSVENIKNICVIIAPFCITEDLNATWEDVWKICSKFIIQGQAQLLH